jgi:hypothetical protein
MAEWPPTLPGTIGPAFYMLKSFQRILRTRGYRVLGLLYVASLCVFVFELRTSEAIGVDTGAKPHQGVEIVENNQYPELHVDGVPFFIHSAAFFYYRIPRDQWAVMLERYSSLGINTIDLYIPWNWHEPKEGEFDFDGHTNPRRDLRSLLALIVQNHLRLIARPGPEILNEWRNGGYPDWLLERPGYNMSTLDILEGRYPPLDGLNAHDAEAAAHGWLGNPTHMAHTRTWLEAVGKELAPFSSHRIVHPSAADSPAGSANSSGPLLFVQIGDDFAEGRTNPTGMEFWRYCEELAGMLKAAGLDVPVFINPTDMRVPPAGSRLATSIGVMGQWYMPPSPHSGPEGREVGATDASEIELAAEELATQPIFPPVVIEYQAGWYTPGDDDRPPSSHPANTLLSSRLLIANGIHGLNYFPLQDTFTPAGYSVPWANRSYRWDAALGPNGDPQPRLQAVQRNAQLLRMWGAQLAASHKRVDFGIVEPLEARPGEMPSAIDIQREIDSLLRLERLATLARLSVEILDPEYQPLERLLNDPILILPAPNPDQPQFELSDRAQTELVDYVRRGGTLAVFSGKPAGGILAQLWHSQKSSSETEDSSAIQTRWKVGEGEVMELKSDFSSWIALDQSLSENRTQPEATQSMNSLREILSAAGIRPIIELSGNPIGVNDLVVDEIVTNDGTGLLGARRLSEGFLSVTNLSGDETADADLEVLSPSASAGKRDGVYIPLHLTLSSKESLLLPIEESLCRQEMPNTPCSDAIESAGGELVDVKRDGRVLELTFYDPASMQVTLHVTQHPSHVTLESTSTPEANWTPDHNLLDVTIPRGAAPDFLRTLRLDLSYLPQVLEVEKPPKSSPGDYDISVWNALELPVSSDTFLKSYPPLVPIDSSNPPVVLISGVNRDAKSIRSVDISVTGPLHGSGSFEIPAKQTSATKISLRPSGVDAMSLAPDSEGLLHGSIKVRSGRDQRTIPIDFLQLPEGQIRRYRFDFDRDGRVEWVLENDALRLILSPESGGRALAFVEKFTSANLTTSVGLFRDAFSYTTNSLGGNPQRARGRLGLFNRPYAAEPLEDPKNPGVRLHYDAPDIFPAGVDIQKSIRFDGTDAVQVNYSVVLHAPAVSDGDGPAQPQSFVAINSFPAMAAPNGPTQFCWQAPASVGDAGKDAEASAGNAQHCEDFVPGGNPLDIPAAIHSIQVHQGGRPGVEISWKCGDQCAHMQIEQKNFSALFRLQFPPMTPGKEEYYELRLRSIDVP